MGFKRPPSRVVAAATIFITQKISCETEFAFALKTLCQWPVRSIKNQGHTMELVG